MRGLKISEKNAPSSATYYCAANAEPPPKQVDDFLPWLPAFFGFGVAFYFSFEVSFLGKISTLSILLLTSLLLSFLNRDSRRSLLFVSCSTFLLGSFYAHFYPKIFLKQTEVTGKIYVDGVGKIESVRKFYNSANGRQGVNLLISEPKLYRAAFVEKKKKIKQPRKKRLVQAEQDNPTKLIKKPRKKKSPKKISDKKFEKNFLNLEGAQEIDRKFLDYSKNYQQVAWRTINGHETFPNPPQKISVNLVGNFQNLAVNDVVSMRMMLQPPNAKEFPDDFDFALDAKMKKIGAYGFVLGEVKIVEKSAISSSDEWFASLRENIRGKIFATLRGDSGAIASALLIGDQSQISKDLMGKIRNSGLAHLLSISGFHLALAGAIFFLGTRFALSRSEYLTLHFDLKKIASIASIFATYFYLKIAGSPLPAQRAFLMVLFVLIALFVGEKINARRAVMTAILLLILFNPYAVFNISFQLSFAAILTLGVFYDELSKVIRQNYNRGFFRKFLRYFLEITAVSILIQIATLPFLMHSFQNAAILGFVANILAIPLTSFLVMPLGFLALLLMPLHLERHALFLMEKGIFLLEKIAILIAEIDYSYFASQLLSSLGLVIAILGLLLICLTKSRLRFIGIVVFALSFTTFFFNQKPDILFDGEQKFFALFDEKNGMVFSKKLRPSKQRELWMRKMGEDEFRVFDHDICDEKKCVIEKGGKKILVLLGRNKISEICDGSFDVLVNLTAKYTLPACISSDKIKIDNFDFYQKGGHFFYFSGDKFLIQTTR